MKPSNVAVVIGEQAPEMERFAAQELVRYLETLYGIRARCVSAIPLETNLAFLLGSPETNSLVRDATRRKPFPSLSAQGIALRHLQLRNCPAVLVGGGSPRATLWAVYELVQRWGVRYLLHGDILPRRPAGLNAFVPPSKGTGGLGAKRVRVPEVLMEPLLPVRQWRLINEHALGPVSWGLAQYRPLIDQLAKLKFNRIFLYIWPTQPFLPLEIRGIKARSGTLFFGFRFPITADTIGRELFGAETEFWNPDLPAHGLYEELEEAAVRHVRGLVDHAHQRGMECVLSVAPTEFPPEFASLLRDPEIQPGHLVTTVLPGPATEIDDPVLSEMAVSTLRATVNTYPQAEYIAADVPEFRTWVGQHERAWKALDARYGIEQVRPLAEVLDAAARRMGYPGGAERAVQEVKGDIAALYFYDRLLNDLGALEGTLRPNVKLMLSCIAEELFPILGRVLPPGSELLNFVDYTPARVLKRREVLGQVPEGMPSLLIYTLHDDNVGLLPQLATGSLHELTLDLRRYGWAGFSTRYWLIGDHDPCVAYLAKGSWDAAATPETVYRDQIRTVCGEGCIADMLAAFRAVEAVTVGLEWHGLGLTFFVPNMLMKHWSPEPMPGDLAEDCHGWERALEAVRRARAKTSSPPGLAYTGYWEGRLEFGIGYLETVEGVHRAAMAEAAGRLVDARREAQGALDSARRAIEAYARVAHDRSDLGAIVMLNQWVYWPLKAKVAELKRRLES